MAIFDDSVLTGHRGNIQLIRPVGRRRIGIAIHDVDGTHSLIRNWPPVMSLTLRHAMTCGLGDDFDSPANLDRLVAQVGREPLEETDRFCIESAGLAALTQMEFGIRRAIELGNVPPAANLALTAQQQRNNSEIIQRIWAGKERFGDIKDPPALLAFIAERGPRLFRFYEAMLNRSSRLANLAAARLRPDRWRVPGALEFMQHLRRVGCRNYFVTGSVVSGPGGMNDDVAALGYDVGPGLLVEQLVGCPPDRKLPKNELMRDVCSRLGADPASVLVVGDGRSEIEAGAAMGCVVISRLDDHPARLRELHAQLGTNLILVDYTDPVLAKLIVAENSG